MDRDDEVAGDGDDEAHEREYGHYDVTSYVADQGKTLILCTKYKGFTDKVKAVGFNKSKE